MQIEFEHVSHVYMPGSVFEKQAVRDVSISIDAGEFVSFIGHTGSGKSTLIQHVNAILQPKSGKVLIDGLDTANKSNFRAIRRKVGMVFQFPEHQLFEETIQADIAYGPMNQGIPKDEAYRLAAEALELVGLPQLLLSKSPFELSGGQMRRVAIAGVLAMKPEILVLDEPTAGLDPEGAQEILSILTMLNKEQGVTILLISHDMEEVARVSSRIIVMSEGTVALDGSVQEVFENGELLEKLGLEVPPVNRFSRIAATFMPGVPRNLFSVEAVLKAVLNEGMDA